MERSWFVWAFVSVALVGFQGCGGAVQVRPSDLAQERTEAIAAAHEEDREFVIRLNPPRCDAPAFEVRLDGTWHRVFAEPDDEEGPVAQARTRLADGSTLDQGAGFLTVAGELSGRTREAPSGSSYLVLEINLLCTESGCPTAEDDD